MKQLLITPSVGRIVWYHPKKHEDGGRLSQHQAAIITYVHSDTLVNITTFDAAGIPRSRVQVFLAPHDHLISREQAVAGYAQWMPWQVDQALKEQASKLVEAARQINEGTDKGRLYPGTPPDSQPARQKTATEQLDELDRFFQETFGGNKPIGPVTASEAIKAEQIKDKLAKGAIKPKQVVVFFL